MNKCVTLATLLILAGAAVTCPAQQRPAEPVTFQKISERLYSIVGGRGAQGGAYIGDNGILVIDSKMDKESVEQVKKQQDKVRALIQQGKDLAQIKGGFNESEAALITSIYNEIKSGS